MGDYDSMGPSLKRFAARFLNFSPVGGHVTSMFAKCWYHQNPLGFISALAEARSLWLWLQVGRNKPCTLAAMTVCLLLGFFYYTSGKRKWMPYAIPCDCHFSLYLMNSTFHTTLDAVGNTLRVHYESMKCDVSFSQGNVSTLFRWGEHVINSCMCKNVLPAYSNAEIL